MSIEPVTAIWVTKDGHKLRICDMDDQHLSNTLQMLLRKFVEFRLSLVGATGRQRDVLLRSFGFIDAPNTMEEYSRSAAHLEREALRRGLEWREPCS